MAARPPPLKTPEHFSPVNTQANTVDVSVKGCLSRVPAIPVQNRQLIVTGRWLKCAVVHDEEWLPGRTFENPAQAVAQLKQHRPRPDMLSFAPSEPEVEPDYPYPFAWDNVAIIRCQSYDAWWQGLSQESRRNVRLAAKRGVIVRAVEFDDQLVAGIKGIYDETPIRQGRQFWHYGKEFAAVKRENATYLERSDFIGAFLGERLIGFIKMVRVGSTARIMQILSLNEHFDKKPANAMIAKAVEIASQKGMTNLAYCRYVYGTKKNSSVTEFKRRNGFVEVRFPRYYIPLTFKGRLALRLGLHRGVKEVLPEWLVEWLLNLRARFYDWKSARAAASGAAPRSPAPASAGAK